jgi:hypothetical protein
MFDARLEINVYHLLRVLGRKAGPWIGAPIALSVQSAELPTLSSDFVLAPPGIVAFELCPPRAESEFLSIKEGSFNEQAHDGNVLAQVPFEYVLPRNLSLSTLVALPVAKMDGGIFVGIELRDLPAVQAFSGSSSIATAPAWRLPRTVKHWTELPAFLAEAMRRDFNLFTRHVWELGGSYMPSPGVTPEVVYPFVAEVEASGLDRSDLHFIELNDLRNRINAIQEGHLLITACRLFHSLDLQLEKT